MMGSQEGESVAVIVIVGSTQPRETKQAVVR